MYYVYILTNKHKTVLYTGYTCDLESRIKKHQSQAYGTTFTSKYNCHFLLYYEMFEYPQEARNRENQIKGWRRSKKEALITSKNPKWEFLNDEI